MKVIKVTREINRGGFGIIDEVICDDYKSYARKTFSPAKDAKLTPAIIEKFRKRFVREVETQKRLPKEFVIPILFSDLSSLSPWFIMPLADYDYTQEIAEVRKTKRKPNGLSDILNALEYVHNLGLVHRDLKPGNILFHDGVWKLSDFGLITQDKDILSLSITSSDGLGYGTENYAAPEQITEFRQVDNRADIYSFGALLHDIFGTGRRTPYSNLTCPGDMGIILDKCTKREPKQRFKDVNSLRSRLLYLLAKAPVAKVNADLQNHIDDLTNLIDLNLTKFEDIIFYLKDVENPERYNLFYEVNEDILQHLFVLDIDLFVEFSLEYVDWVKRSTFSFDYSDVVALNVYFIYAKTNNIDLRAKCVISVAELGRSHNRWFVMKNVFKMANNDIEDGLALRLQIEIDIETRNKENFNRCAEILQWSISNYHHMIVTVL